MNSPQGDIKLKKAAESFNTYNLSMSHGQLLAIMNALAKDHSDPVSDELYAMFSYYMKELPGPGESKEDLEAQNPEAGTELMGDAKGPAQYPAAETPDDGVGLPMPPSDEGAPADEGLPDLSAENDLPVDEEPPVKKPAKPAEDTTEADEALPEPPKE